MACGAPVLASDTAPVREVVRNGHTGLLAGFYDIDRWCSLANAALDDPAGHRALGQTARDSVREQFSLDVCLPKLHKLFRATANRGTQPAIPSVTAKAALTGDRIVSPV